MAQSREGNHSAHHGGYGRHQKQQQQAPAFFHNRLQIGFEQQ